MEGAGRSRQGTGSVLHGERPHSPARIWFLFQLLCMLLVAVAFPYLDVPVARRFYGMFGAAKGLATGFASAVLLSIEAAIALALIVTRIVRGHLSRLGEVTALACLTSICAYAINDGALKFFFGVPNPTAVMHGSRHAFHFLAGSSSCSFPSGHMVLAGSFAGVFTRFYRGSVLPLSALLLIAAVLLIAGDWHFVSDVIAGSFLGVSAGFLAGKLWAVHSKQGG